jgi:hypothetical protein
MADLSVIGGEAGWMLAKQHGDAVLAELSEAERATRLIGPPLVSPAQPSRPDAPEVSGGAS